MPTYVVPAVYDSTKKIIRPAGACERIAPEYIRIAPKMLVSSDASNGLRVGSDCKLHVLLVSKADNNILKQGSDYGVFLDASNVLSNGDANLLVVDSVDKRVILTKDMLLDAGLADDQIVRNLFRRHLDEITESKELAAQSATDAAASARAAAASAQAAHDSQVAANASARDAATCDRSAQNSMNAAAASARDAAASATASQQSAQASAQSAQVAAGAVQASIQSATRAENAAVRAENAANRADADAARTQADRAYVDGLIDHAEAVVREEAAHIAADSITDRVVELASEQAAEEIAQVESLQWTVAEGFAKVARTDAEQAETLDKLLRYNAEQDAALASVETALYDEIEETNLVMAETAASIARANVQQTVDFAEQKVRFDEHQLNAVERFSDLAYASVTHTREIQELQDYPFVMCETVTSLARSSVEQSVMLAEILQRLAA